jgi:hypothetical protein
VSSLGFSFSSSYHGSLASAGTFADSTKYGKVIYDAVLEEEGPPLHICNRICGFLNLPEAEDGDDAENV